MTSVENISAIPREEQKTAILIPSPVNKDSKNASVKSSQSLSLKLPPYPVFKYFPPVETLTNMILQVANSYQ